MNEHLTPELVEQLNHKCPEEIEKKIKIIISHIDENSDNPEHIYAQGIAYYYLGEYEKCMEKEEEAFPYFEDEMGIAAIFWHTLAAWRCGKAPTLLNEHYTYGMLVGHHRSYNRIMAIACGNVSLDAAMMLYDHMFQSLDIAIYGYGLACYLEHIGEIEKAEKMKAEVLTESDFWIAYTWLAAYIEEKRKNETSR